MNEVLTQGAPIAPSNRQLQRSCGADLWVVIKAPALPRGAVRGCSYLKWRAEGRFLVSPGWSPTPPKSMLNRLSSSRGSPW